MSDNTALLCLLIALLVFGVLTAGSPDLLDAIIARVGGGRLGN